MTITSIDCVLPRPSIAALHQQLITEMSQRLLGGAPVVAGSYEDVLSFVMAGTVNLMHGYVTQSLKENDPATMCCDNLVRYAALHGIDMMSSTRAKGYVGITGGAGAAIPTTIRFVYSAMEYKLDPGVTWNPTVLNTAGEAALRIVAVNAGAAYDLPPGIIMVVATTLPGINGTGTVLGSGLTGGTDTETCEHLRVRVLAAEAAGVIATNLDWYIQQAAKYPGVTRVCVDESPLCCCNPSFVTLYPFMEGVYGTVTTPPYGVPPEDVLCSMTDWMFGNGMGSAIAPIGVNGAFATARPTVMNVTVNCFAGCPEAAAEQIEVALAAFLRANYCVGSTMCKEAIRHAAYAVVAPNNCFSSITLTFDATLAHEDSAFAYLACAHFPVMGTVTMLPGYGM